MLVDDEIHLFALTGAAGDQRTLRAHDHGAEAAALGGVGDEIEMVDIESFGDQRGDLAGLADLFEIDALLSGVSVLYGHCSSIRPAGRLKLTFVAMRNNLGNRAVQSTVPKFFRSKTRRIHWTNPSVELDFWRCATDFPEWFAGALRANFPGSQGLRQKGQSHVRHSG
jgi:hypothetical protein